MGNRFSQLGQLEGLTFYRAEIVPWLWLLSLSTDCRIFQNKSVPEIVEQVFKDLGYTAFDIRCAGTYPKREYCVQYRETHLAFVSRLLEEEGIFYFFEHQDGKHTLVLADRPSAVQPCPGQPSARMAAQPPKYPGLPSETPDTLQPATDGFDHIRREVMIPMRDGLRLRTVVLVPKGAARAPILS